MVNIRVLKAMPQGDTPGLPGMKLPDIPGLPFPFGGPDEDEQQPAPHGKSKPRLSGSGSGFVWDTAGTYRDQQPCRQGSRQAVGDLH